MHRLLDACNEGYNSGSGDARGVVINEGGARGNTGQLPTRANGGSTRLGSLIMIAMRRMFAEECWAGMGFGHVGHIESSQSACGGVIK